MDSFLEGNLVFASPPSRFKRTNVTVSVLLDSIVCAGSETEVPQRMTTSDKARSSCNLQVQTSFSIQLLFDVVSLEIEEHLNTGANVRYLCPSL